MNAGLQLPTSPLGLPQEHPEAKKDPWRVLVASILAFQHTDTERANEVLVRVLERWPTDSRLAGASEPELVAYLTPLGMQRKRADYLIHASLGYLMEWHLRPGASLIDLRGVGNYGVDSWNLFVEGRTDVHPRDRKLRNWLDWRIETWGRG